MCSISVDNRLMNTGIQGAPPLRGLDHHGEEGVYEGNLLESYLHSCGNLPAICGPAKRCRRQRISGAASAPYILPVSAGI